jgi:hypothetical protein
MREYFVFSARSASPHEMLIFISLFAEVQSIILDIESEFPILEKD